MTASDQLVDAIARDLLARFHEYHDTASVPLDALTPADQGAWRVAALHALEQAADEIITADRVVWWVSDSGTAGRLACMQTAHTGPPCGPHCLFTAAVPARPPQHAHSYGAECPVRGCTWPAVYVGPARTPGKAGEQ